MSFSNVLRLSSDGAPLATAFQLRFVGMMFADMYAEISTLLCLVFTVWALVRRFLVAAFVIFMAAQSGFPAIAFAAMAACPQFVFSALE